MSAATGTIETTTRADARLRLDNITLRYGSLTVIDDVPLDLEGGELVAFVGPSGCWGIYAEVAAGGAIAPGEAVGLYVHARSLPPSRPQAAPAVER
jgi:hypothetical protein